MSDDRLPFYAQTAVLDEYIHADNPKADPLAVEVIIEALNAREDLRDYFFRQGPSAAWAEILWEHGFFDSPPTPERTKDGYVTPWWDVQQFLISVARQVPDIAVKHVETVDGEPIYLARAITALLSVPPEKVSQIIPRIIQWLEEPQIAQTIASVTFDLIERLVERGDSENALELFDTLTTPLPPSEMQNVDGLALRTEARSRYRNTWREDRTLPKSIDLFEGQALIKVSTILEKHLCSSLVMEAQAKDSPEDEFTSWWRSAIEDTEQDLSKSYKDHLLEALRDSLEKLINDDRAFVESQVRRLLNDKHEVLRRLGIYFLHKFPSFFPLLVGYILRNADNLNDVGIHHEIFMLLQNGYPFMESHEQEALVELIFQGPPSEYLLRLAVRAERNYGEDPKQYIEKFQKIWIRDRLWMLQEYLVGTHKQLLDDLVDEFGQPDHPAFTAWIGEAHWVKHVGPLDSNKLSEMAPDALVEFIQQWEPDESSSFGPEEISHQGLADNVASLIVSNPQKYVAYLVPIAMCRPVFADSLFRQLAENGQPISISWEVVIELIEQLLGDESVRESADTSADENWTNVRREMVRLLQIGLKNRNRAIPFGLLEKVKDILLVLVDDSDPSPERDQPKEGWFGHNDPATVAINHVRPIALMALIEYARYRSTIMQEAISDGKLTGVDSRNLELNVKQTLSRKLDRQEDPGWSVHSVYGRYLPLLHWFDAAWVTSHLEQIFPEGPGEESTWSYVAAWDSYVAFNHFYRPVFEILRPKYERAILNLKQGLVTQTHLDPAQHLARHVGQEYLSSDYELHSPIGQQSLLVMFFEQAPPETHSHLVWWFWRVCEDADVGKLNELWPRIRSLWEWRVQKASAANHPNTFDREMEWFAYLPAVAPQTENIESMWPLLIGVIPHIARPEDRTLGWRSLENYLANEVKHYPKQAAKLYRLMYENKPKIRWFHNRSEVQDIIETAAKSRDARQEVLDLIDTMARRGIHRYRYIYEKLT